MKRTFWPLSLVAGAVIFGLFVSPVFAQQFTAAKVLEGLIPDEANPIVAILRRGGVLMYPILGCSILLVAVALERLIALRRARVIPQPFVDRFLADLREGLLDRDAALLRCRSDGSPVARVLEHAVRRWGRPAVEIQQSVAEGGQREVLELRRNLRVINGISTVAPLLGLLGTVIGMIRCFAEVAAQTDAMGKPEALAQGIYVALYTTAFGLSVAIPALIVYYYFLGRVDRLVAEIDALAQEVIELVAGDGAVAPVRGIVPADGDHRPQVRTAKTVHSARQSA